MILIPGKINLFEVVKLTLYTILQESYILLATIYGGIIIGFIYDLYRIIRGLFRPKKIATTIQDLIFWGVIFVVAFYVLIFSNQGAIRFYNFLGFILGSVFYQTLLSGLVIKSLVFILKMIKNFLNDLYQIIKYPFNVALCLMSGPYSYCKKKTKPIYYKARRIGKIPGNIVRDTKKTLLTYFKKK